MSKEQIYDAQISPLMKQVIAISAEHGIAMMASFSIGHDGEGPNGEDCSNLTCTSHLPDGDQVFDERYSKCAAAIRRGASQSTVMHITTQNQDGSKTLTAVI